ncbi:hypothetical protein H257_15139 [Aphanomyces astaci]|uniref:Myb/SANT-like domain-containing protein n=1 Tax=Aphanomyces astaci TaxID=112090 RepID=W4FQ83_APHAT|nr:hypothetical protein H257_15139 [Aphanomyces astaci]ETV68984.1 hypothetical protein H257_15139 [Aphanomyces astaci]|eukprot:XP_009841443.1 hypothetical protein H257_15139 [Aphanomyces astaci]
MLDAPTPNAKPNKRKVRWDDESVAELFRLRYKSHFTSRVDSKNSAEKKTAYVMLASEINVSMEKDFSVAQVQDKFGKLKTSWSLTNPSNPSETENAPWAPLPPHCDQQATGTSEEARKSLESEALEDGCATNPAAPACPLGLH